MTKPSCSRKIFAPQHAFPRSSFTEAQARSRLESMGYSNVGGLAKDNQSIWRGAATKDGKSVNVAVDFKGNVVAQ